MATRVAEVVRSLDRDGLHRVVCFEPAERETEVAEWLGSAFSFRAQPEGDPGCRLQNGFLKAFRNGARRVVAIGTDCVGITREILSEAFDALSEVDATLGPSMDGGYYLLGLSRPCRNVFRGIPWNTDRTLRETLARLRGCGLQVRLLPPLNGVVTSEDLLADRTDLPRGEGSWRGT